MYTFITEVTMDDTMTAAVTLLSTAPQAEALEAWIALTSFIARDRTQPSPWRHAAKSAIMACRAVDRASDSAVELLRGPLPPEHRFDKEE